VKKHKKKKKKKNVLVGSCVWPGTMMQLCNISMVSTHCKPARPCQGRGVHFAHASWKQLAQFCNPTPLTVSNSKLRCAIGRQLENQAEENWDTSGWQLGNSWGTTSGRSLGEVGHNWVTSGEPILGNSLELWKIIGWQFGGDNTATLTGANGCVALAHQNADEVSCDSVQVRRNCTSHSDTCKLLAWNQVQIAAEKV